MAKKTKKNPYGYIDKDLVDKIIKENGLKKTYIAKKMGLNNSQALTRILNSKDSEIRIPYAHVLNLAEILGTDHDKIFIRGEK